MLKNRLILTDVDEVCLQWSTGFTKFLYDHHNFENIKPRNNHSVYKWLEIHEQEANDLILEFNSSCHFAALEPFDCAERILPKLYNEGYTIVAITSCSSNSIIANMRKENLEKYFGRIFQDIICLDFHDDKGKILKNYQSSFWIEDHPKWAVVGADLGHKTFLIDHIHNKSINDPRILRVDSWYTIYDEIYNFNFGNKVANF